MPHKVIPEADLTARCRAVTKPGLYSILPRANRVPSKLQGLEGIDAQVLVAPQAGARFVEHELLIYVNGRTAKPIDDGLEQFLFVLEGSLELRLEGTDHALGSGDYAWVPANHPYSFRNRTTQACRVLWLRRRYQGVDGLETPSAFLANERDVPAVPEDTYLEQHLIPYEHAGFDMAVNLLNFDPGIHFGAVESHVMEHGLYMLAGRGIYWLNGDYHEVLTDDFIYMAPYCPQFFYATGWERGRYLIYKDVNRDYSESLCKTATWLASGVRLDEELFSQGQTPEQFIRSMAVNREKLEELTASCSLGDAERKALRTLPHNLRVLVIAEDWSGDVLYNLPILICIAREAEWDVRIFRRDDRPDLIRPYRKEGLYRSIPVFVFLDKDFHEIAHWTERPAAATQVIEQEALALRRRLRESHQAEWRRETIREIIELLSEAS